MTKRRKSKTERELDEKVSEFYERFFSGVQVSMMDIPAIYRDIEDAILNGTADEKVPIMVELWRVK